MTTQAQATNGTRAAVDTSVSQTERLAEKVHRAVDTVASQVADAERNVRDVAASKQDSLREVADVAAGQAKLAGSEARRFIDENPMATAGIAFAAGILFSAWLRR